MQAKVDSICIYPVKSMKAVSMNSATLTRKGLVGDREWCVAKKIGHRQYKVLTQRQEAILALISPSFSEEGSLCLHHEELGSITVGEVAKPSSQVEVQIWGDLCKAEQAAEPRQVNKWLQEALGTTNDMALLRYCKSSLRLPGAPERFGADATYFADAAPYLLANRQSFDALQSTLDGHPQAGMITKPLDISRFRANLIVDGLPAFKEHEYSECHCQADGGSYSLKLVDHCQRCAMITINQRQGARDERPIVFQELAALNAMPNAQKLPAFGVNVCLSQGEGGTITVGDVLSFR